LKSDNWASQIRFNICECYNCYSKKRKWCRFYNKINPNLLM